jgi:hypothetical protein
LRLQLTRSPAERAILSEAKDLLYTFLAALGRVREVYARAMMRVLCLSLSVKITQLVFPFIR